MKSAKYIKSLLQDFYEKSELNPEHEPLINEIKNAIEERDQELSKLSSSWDDSKDDVEFTPMTKNDEEWEEKYAELKKRYIDTFFNGNTDSVPLKENESLFSEENEVTTEPITIDDLIVDIE